MSYLLCGGDDCWGHQPAGGGDLRGRWGRVARWRRASRGMASSKVGFFLLPKDSEPQPQPSPRSGFIFRSIFCPGCLTLSVSLKIEIILTFIRKWLITNANLKAKVWFGYVSKPKTKLHFPFSQVASLPPLYHKEASDTYYHIFFQLNTGLMLSETILKRKVLQKRQYMYIV